MDTRSSFVPPSRGEFQKILERWCLGAANGLNSDSSGARFRDYTRVERDRRPASGSSQGARKFLANDTEPDTGLFYESRLSRTRDVAAGNAGIAYSVPSVSEH